MLINKIGVETDEEIIDLRSRRVSVDPRNRETTTMLLQAALRAVKRSEVTERESPATATPIAALEHPDGASAPAVSTTPNASRTDAA